MAIVQTPQHDQEKILCLAKKWEETLVVNEWLICKALAVLWGMV